MTSTRALSVGPPPVTTCHRPDNREANTSPAHPRLERRRKAIKPSEYPLEFLVGDANALVAHADRDPPGASPRDLDTYPNPLAGIVNRVVDQIRHRRDQFIAVAALDRTSVGKIDKKRLRKKYAAPK